MLKKSLRIIGINPGTRYLGLAVIQDMNLFDWRVKLLEGPWSKKKIDRVMEIISEYIDFYNLSTIALKKLHPSRSSKHLKHLVEKIESLAKEKKLKMREYSIKEVEKVFLVNEKYNKKNLAEKMVSLFPCLVHELRKEKTNKNRYHMRMFEAVALAACCFQKN
jgi:Holliday junction resolvasome RuvABC endonuclease subunit